MKKTNSISMLVLSAVFCMVAFSSCKKKDDDTSTSTGTLMLHLHTLVDTTEVEDYDDTLMISGGREIAVSKAQLYISNIKLIKTDGTVVNGPSTNVLMQQGTEEYEIGAVPAGNYKSIRFDVGLSDSTNAATPLTTDVALNQPSMWFGSAAQPDGFVFINFQGIIDTTTTATGTNLIPFSYKIGTNAHRVTITMPDKNYTVAPDQPSVVHMEVDYAKLFDGIDLKTNSNLTITTAAQNSGSLATQVAANISNLFDYEEE